MTTFSERNCFSPAIIIRIYSHWHTVLKVFVVEQIFKWHWLSCRPIISMELACDNTFNIDVTLGNAADLTWIKGFQVQ